jgi:hypothetical protein
LAALQASHGPDICNIVFNTVFVVTISYQIMLRCWDLEPAHRPTFTNLKNIMDNFMKDDHSSIIHFPDPDTASTSSASEGYCSAGDVALPGYDPLAPIAEVDEDGPFHEDRGEFLVVGNPIRRHASEPRLEGREDDMEERLNEYGGHRKRSHSNPYVRTPRRDSRLSTRKSFEWMIDTPQIRIHHTTY